ncbi:MAG: hypothetical protein V4789_17800, partial [Burkholderia gladioli]
GMVDISNENDCYLCVADTVATLCNVGVLRRAAFVMECVGTSRLVASPVETFVCRARAGLGIPLARGGGSR